MSAIPSRTGFTRSLIALAGALGYASAIPVLLWRAAQWPLPHRIPSLNDLTLALTPGRRPGAEVVVKAFAVVAWILWAQIGVAVIAEIRAQRRGRTTALRTLPAWARPLIVRLAASVVALIPTIGVRPVAAAPAIPMMAFSAPACPSQGDQLVDGSEPSAERAPDAVSAPSPAAAISEYHVRPGDNLWDIAAEHLGDPRRYQEIFTMNRSRVQPDGRRLTRSGLIRPGWILDLPVATLSPTDVSPDPAQPATATPAIADLSPATRPSAPPSLTEEPRTSTSVEVASGGTETGPVVNRPDAERPASRPIEGPGLPLLVASSVVAGLGLLRRNRRNARRRHHRFPSPPATLVDVEREVRAIASNEAPRWVAAAVRHLAGALSEEGAPPPPDVLAVRAGELGVEVLIARPWPMAPGRFVPVDDGHTWRLDPAVELDELEELAGPSPSYLTALATLGDSQTGAVLVDLDQVGTLVIEGAPEQSEAVLGSIAMEVATAPWADLVDLCLVGAPEPFAGIERLERVRILSPDTAVAALKRCAGSPGVGGLTAAALGDIPPGPTVTIVWPGALSDDELAALAAMAEPHTGLVLVAGGGPLSSPWRLTIGEDGTGILSPLGLPLAVPTATTKIDALASLLVDAAAESTDILVEPQTDHPTHPTDAPEDSMPDADKTAEAPSASSPADGPPEQEDIVHRVPDEPATTPVGPSAASANDEPKPTAEVRILGPVEITWRGPAPQRPQPGELVAYLATHRYPVNGDRVRLALWPARADDDRFGERNKSTLWSLTSRTRQALGKDDAGQDLLPREAGNLLSLSPAVRCDWDHFRQLVERARRHPASAIDTLVRALDLVRGTPFQGVRSGYAWVELEHLDAEIDAAITDAALDLVDLALADGDLTGARHAIRQGLLGCPGSEPLLRAAMRVSHAAGDQPGVERAWRDLERVTGELGFDPHPESLDLYRALRRQSAKA